MRIGLVIVLTALATTACDQADASICKPLFDEIAAQSLPKDVATELRLANKCVRRQAYKLGFADGPPADIANAAVAACSDAIELYVLTGAQAGLIEAYETDQTMDAERKEFARLARSYVIQTRAGHCEAIPESKL